MDSDYLPSSDNESDVSNISIESISETFQDLSEDDIIEISLDVFDQFEFHIKMGCNGSNSCWCPVNLSRHPPTKFIRFKYWYIHLAHLGYSC